jgi:NADP-dependent aldehyde dehydrogenase
LVVLIAGPATDAFVTAVAEKFRTAPAGVLLSKNVAQSLARAVATLQQAGAELVAGGEPKSDPGYRYANTLLKVTGRQFLSHAAALQTEAFGNESLFVIAADVNEAALVLRALEGNLTGCIYSAADGRDEAAYRALAPLLRQKVGRLLNDKMPTGVAVSPAMNHGGPYPATGHPGFTAVGIPASLRRFAALHCYDGVRENRLPALLQNANPTGKTWRLIDGQWTTAAAT